MKDMQTAQLDHSLIPAPSEGRAGVLAAWPLAAPAISKAAKQRIAFLYLGRRGGIARLAYELAVAATRHHQIDPLFVVSDSNELFGLMQTLPGRRAKREDIRVKSRCVDPNLPYPIPRPTP